MDFNDRDNTDRNLLIQKLKSVLVDIPDIRFAVLFGSQARGDSHCFSDLDLAIYFEQAPHLLELGNIISQIQELSGLKTDIVELQGLPTNDPLLAYNIVSDAVLVLENQKHALADFTADAWSRYFDAADFLRSCRDAMVERLKQNQFARMVHHA